MSAAHAAAYLAAMIDGEGCVCFRRGRVRGGRLQFTRGVEIFNTDLDIILAVIDNCDALGITHTVRERLRRPKRKEGWKVGIYRREDFETLMSLVPIQSQEKRDKLAAIVTSYPPPRDRPSAEELRLLYAEDGRSMELIPAQYSVTAAAVRNWMDDAGIPRRSQSEAWIHRKARSTQAA